MALLGGLLTMFHCPAFAAEGTTPDVLPNSRYVKEIPLPEDAAGELLEFQVPPDMFDGALWDLGDLRLLDASDKEIPYAVRARVPRSQRERIASREFNRGSTGEGATEISLDLGETPLEHNEMEVHMGGDGFRRRAVLEGSADGNAWSRLAEKNLLRFKSVRDGFVDERIEYPASRFRYLRLRVEKDPQVDREGVEIGEVVVRRTVEVPGQFLPPQEAKLSPREPSRSGTQIGSEWIIDLGGLHVPCQRLEFEIEGREFARDYSITTYRGEPNTETSANEYLSQVPAYVAPRIETRASATLTLGEAFSQFSSASGTWRRMAGETPQPLVAELGEVRAGRLLKLFVADGANPPLKINQVRYVAAECVVVIPSEEVTRGPLRAYFGNSSVGPPSYDFARNLPDKLDPPPTKLTPEPRERNSAYVPPPLPFTERFAWLIHTVLGAVSLVLAGLVVQLARRVIVRHDARAAAV